MRETRLRERVFFLMKFNLVSVVRLEETKEYSSLDTFLPNLQETTVSVGEHDYSCVSSSMLIVILRN